MVAKLEAPSVNRSHMWEERESEVARGATDEAGQVQVKWTPVKCNAAKWRL